MIKHNMFRGTGENYGIVESLVSIYETDNCIPSFNALLVASFTIPKRRVACMYII